MRALVAVIAALPAGCSSIDDHLAACRHDADRATIALPACPVPTGGRTDCREAARYILVRGCMELRGYEPAVSSEYRVTDYPDNQHLWKRKAPK